MLAAGKFPSSPAALGEPYQSCFDKTADVVLSLAYSFYLRRKNRSFRALALNGILSWLTLGVMALFFPGSFILHGAASGRPAAMSPVLKGALLEAGGKSLNEFSISGKEGREGHTRAQANAQDQDYQLGLDFLRSGQTDKALESLKNAVRLAPERAVAQCALGQAYVNAGRLSEAIGCFQVCANLDVNNPKPRYDLGQAYLRQALNVTSKILRADSNSPYARRIFAENFLGRNDWPEAETEYRLALKAQPRAADLRLGLAVIYMRTGHMNKAREQVARALETNPGLVAARYELAVFDFLQNDFAAAIAEVQSIAAANPKFLVSPIHSLVTAVPESGRNAACRNFSQFNPGAPQQPALAFWNQWCGPKPGSVELPRQPARLLISPLAERTGTAATLDHGCANGSCETCEAKLKPATSLSSTNPAAEAGRCFYEIGDYDTAYGRLLEALNSEAEDLATLYWFEESCRLLAERSFEAVHQIDPDSYLLHLLSAQNWEQLQRLDLAVREYRAAIARQPRAANIRVLLGHLEWKWQKYDEALPDLMDALRLDPDEPVATYLVGDIWVQKQEAEKALPYLQRAITLRPGFLNAKASLGRALSQLGRFQDAVREFESVASADADGSIHYQLYRLYLRLGSTEKAETCLAAAERIRSQRRRGNNLSETETP